MESAGNSPRTLKKIPSNSGIHILIKVKLPAGGHSNQDKGLEIYDWGRFVTITGHSIGDVPIHERQGAANTLVKRYRLQDFAPPTPPVKHPIDYQSHQYSDDEINDLMANAQNGPKIMTLLKGDMAGYVSQSEADLALCNCIKFYTQAAAQRNSLFRQSAFYRPKLD